MKRKLLPVLLAVVGLGAGIGIGILLKPAPLKAHVEAEAGPDAAEAGHAEAKPAKGGHGEPGESEIVTLENQFVVPLIEREEVSALVVLSLNLEVDSGGRAKVYGYEAKLRDAFLGVLFEHANAGGFSGAFTSSGTINLLRTALRESAQKTLGPMVREVLITDLIRQKV